MQICACTCQCLWRQEALDSPGARFRGSCELLGTKLCPVQEKLVKLVSYYTLNNWSISPDLDLGKFALTVSNCSLWNSDKNLNSIDFWNSFKWTVTYNQKIVSWQKPRYQSFEGGLFKEYRKLLKGHKQDWKLSIPLCIGD